MLGVFLGAIGGPLAGLLIWAIAALFVLIRRAVNRVKTGHPEGA